jgi:hypothetical protein
VAAGARAAVAARGGGAGVVAPAPRTEAGVACGWSSSRRGGGGTIGADGATVAAGRGASPRRDGAAGIREDVDVGPLCTGAPPSPAGIADRGPEGSGGIAGDAPSKVGSRAGAPPFRRATASGMRWGAEIWIVFPHRQRMR